MRAASLFPKLKCLHVHHQTSLLNYNLSDLKCDWSIVKSVTIENIGGELYMSTFKIFTKAAIVLIVNQNLEPIILSMKNIEMAVIIDKAVEEGNYVKFKAIFSFKASQIKVLRSHFLYTNLLEDLSNMKSTIVIYKPFLE